MSIIWRKCIKCGLSRAADPEVTYHRFPNPGKNTVDKARAWAKFCWPDQDWSSVESLKAIHFGCKILCGRHFLNSQFIDENRKKLCKHAVPTVTNLDYYKTKKVVSADVEEEPPEPVEEGVDFTTEVEYLSDWDSLEDTSDIQEYSAIINSANVKNESYNGNTTNNNIKTEPLKQRKGLYTQNIKNINKIQTSTPMRKNSRTVENENNISKNENYSSKNETYSSKNKKYSIANEIQDYSNSPVLNEIVRRALSKSGVTMKKIAKPKSESEKIKELDIKKSGIQTRKPIIVKKGDISMFRKKQTSNVQPIKTDFTNKEGQFKQDFNESQEDDVFANNDPDDEDYNPSDETGSDSDGEEKCFKGFDTKTPSKSAEPVDPGPRHGICRCCLKKGEHRAANIHEVLSCLNIHPSEDPELSPLVCETCDEFLKEVSKFRNMVATSEVELTSRMHLMQEEEEKTTRRRQQKDTADDNEVSLDMDVEIDPHHQTEDSIVFEGATEGDSDGLSDQEELVRELAKPIDRLRRMTKPRPPNSPTNRQRLQALRDNVITIILNSTILPFTFNKDPRFINHFECVYRDARFAEFHLLRKHMQQKHPKLNKEYIVTFVNQLQKGILRADVSNLTCRRCNEKVTNLDDLVQHLINEHGIKYQDMNWDPPHNILGFDLSTEEIKCPVCVKIFPTFRGVLAHMNQHYGSFLCPLCGMKFLYPDSFSKHKKSHQKIVPLKTVICDKCGVNLNSRLELDNHRKNNCGSTFKVGNYKKRVLDKKPTMAKKIEIQIDNFDCMFCDAKFTNGDDFFEHRMEHLSRSKDASYVCEICGYTVPKKNQMRRHLKRHYGIKDIVCQVCNKGFVSPQDLKLHSNTHQARFQCPFCSDVCFMSKSECSYHIKSEHEDMLPKKR